MEKVDHECVYIGATAETLYERESPGPVYLLLGIPAWRTAVISDAWEIVSSPSYGSHSDDYERVEAEFAARANTTKDHVALAIVCITYTWSYSDRGGRAVRSGGSIVHAWCVSPLSPVGRAAVAPGRHNLWEAINRYATDNLKPQRETDSANSQDEQAEAACDPAPQVGPDSEESVDEPTAVEIGGEAGVGDSST